MIEPSDVSRVQNAAPWAQTVGYCRALRSGPFVHVSGTAAVQPDGRVGPPGDPEAQARRCLEIMVAALEELGASSAHVVRTRVYIRDAGDWEAVGRAHGEVFAGAPPASTMIVASFIDPEMLVEMEAEAIIPDERRETQT
jgi:enamine deaminase RidA (YjgF/YER057c/UK114 family)